MTRRPRTRAQLGVAAAALLLAGCGGRDPAPADPGLPEKPGTTAAEADQAGNDPTEATDNHDTTPVEPSPLRPGETRTELAMPAAYTPSAPYGAGTDDYRCFLLDPGLTEPTWLTGTHVRPGNPELVHHVILFQVPPGRVAAPEATDAAEEGEGWTCFGGTGIDAFQDVDDAAWIGAWAPGGTESVHRPGFGLRLAPGTHLVMQVHYNLLAGQAPDTSSVLLRLAPGTSDLEQLHTVLLTAPVELPCRRQHADGPLCERQAAVMDVARRFGLVGAGAANALHFLCGGAPRAGEVQSCTRRISQKMTIHAAAGHMHLLGREIRIETNPGTPEARTVLDIPVWDFDNQGSHPVEPVRLEAGDTVRVTCRHVQWLRDRLPAFEGQPDRYVVWGEGTTDEMCLGILQATRP